ncbi:hypothetical protein BDN71DRAFT_1510842 [Pleurotus eryngii]|uniref:Uncharacterized protein n=1 Tax=Pleurotus eryngii TaxID=5323 RepID=A0A9P5ZPS9_PLEER|nr:hypothetical protein BDN71DRAFT_1510842 [Pleurotus eryngii]
MPAIPQTDDFGSSRARARLTIQNKTEDRQSRRFCDVGDFAAMRPMIATRTRGDVMTCTHTEKQGGEDAPSCGARRTWSRPFKADKSFRALRAYESPELGEPTYRIKASESEGSIPGVQRSEIGIPSLVYTIRVNDTKTSVIPNPITQSS